MHTRPLSLTRVLLLCGAVAGPFFLLLVLSKDYTVPAFNPRIHLLSQLSLGEWGWVQIANFVLAGVLNLLYAAGLWRRLHPGRGGTWGPLLIGAYGLGLLVVGIFRTDPANGFPPGVVTQSTWHGAIHALGGLFIFVVMAAALVVFARKEREWAFYCLISAVLLLIIFFWGFTAPALTVRTLRLATLVGWMATSWVAIKLLSTPDSVQQTRDS